MSHSISIEVEGLANELLDNEKEGLEGMSDLELSKYLQAQSVSCHDEWREYKDKPEMAKMFSLLADGYQRAAEIVRAGA